MLHESAQSTAMEATPVLLRDTKLTPANGAYFTFRRAIGLPDEPTGKGRTRMPGAEHFTNRGIELSISTTLGWK